MIRHMRSTLSGGLTALVVAALLTACGSSKPAATPTAAAPTTAPTTVAAAPTPAPATVAAPTSVPPTATTVTHTSHDSGSTTVSNPQQNATPTAQSPAAYTPDVSFVLRTNVGHDGLTYVGVGGPIDGITNPDLPVAPGDVVQVTLINGDGAEHDIFFPDFNAHSEHIIGKGSSSSVVFRADKEGTFLYFCTLPGHQQAGMQGQIIVGEGGDTGPSDVASIVRDPADLPPSVGDRAPQTVQVELETVEVEGQLATGTTYAYWTFNGQVPGPFLRVRQGDTVELTLHNNATSRMIHSIDLHAVTGPGGGATVMQVPPGEEKTFTFQALSPGLYVYHCATPMVAHHISNGMYGLILVEPEGGLPPVDREFYVMQGEIYTQGPLGQRGAQAFSVEKLLAEDPEYVVLNGAVGSLTAQSPLRANVGETVRIYFGVGGPNLTSAFHVIGEIFDRVYDQASLTSAPLTDVQTTLVAPGGATMVEFTLQVPGQYILVDHALSRMDRGLMGFLLVEGEDNPDIYHEGALP